VIALAALMAHKGPRTDPQTPCRFMPARPLSR
jgi:hypothetical protein